MCVCVCVCARSVCVCVFECECEESRDSWDVTPRHTRSTSEPVSFICQQKTRKKKMHRHLFTITCQVLRQKKKTHVQKRIFFFARNAFLQKRQEKNALFLRLLQLKRQGTYCTQPKPHSAPLRFDGRPLFSLSLSVSLRRSVALNVCIICMYGIHKVADAHKHMTHTHTNRRGVGVSRDLKDLGAVTPAAFAHLNHHPSSQ